jgi:hypothetical protein
MLLEEQTNDELVRELIKTEVRAERAERMLEERVYVWVVEYRTADGYPEIAHIASTKEKAVAFLREYQTFEIMWWALYKVGVDMHFLGINYEYYDKNGNRMENQPL